MVIDPAPLAILIPLPAVRVESEYPAPLPMSNVPLAADEPLIPVPPLRAGSIPVTSVAPPARLIAELDSSPVALACTTPVDRFATATLPELPPPKVRACFAVVWIEPAAVMNAAPLVPADTDAVGVPDATLRTANLADEVAVPPRMKSRDGLLVYIAP